jgi:hypothetical protein
MKNVKFILTLIVMFVMVELSTAQTFNNINCNDSIVPTPVSYTNVTVQATTVQVYGQSSTPCYTDFVFTPIYVKGNTERRLTNLAQSTRTTNQGNIGANMYCWFNKQQLIDVAVALGAGNGPIKFKFGIVTYNNTFASPEVKSSAVNIR